MIVWYLHIPLRVRRERVRLEYENEGRARRGPWGGEFAETDGGMYRSWVVVGD